MSNYLVHHGILGQKWGKKNGPPYPLNFDDLSAEEREKAKSESIRKGDIRTAGANKKHYTDQELNAVMIRFDINQKIDKLNAAQIETGLKKVKRACDTMGEISKYGEKAISGYNTIAKLSNSLVGTNLPKIDGNPKGKNNNQQNNGNNNNNQQNNNNQKQNNSSVKVVKNYSDGELTSTSKTVTKNGKSVTKNKQYTT